MVWLFYLEVCVFGYITHLIFGFFTAAMVASTSDQLMMCMLGSLLPDIDTKYSLLGKFNPLAWFGLMRHRGKTHTILGCALFALLGWPFGAYWATFAGCLSHLVADKISSALNGKHWKIRLK